MAADETLTGERRKPDGHPWAIDAYGVGRVYRRAKAPYVGAVLGMDENGLAIQPDPVFGFREPTEVEIRDAQKRQRGHLDRARKVKRFLGIITGRLVCEIAFADRLKACRACPARREKHGHEYCGACGCPTTRLWKVARLFEKLWYAKLECPLGCFGAVTERRLLASRREVRAIKRRLATAGG